MSKKTALIVDFVAIAIVRGVRMGARGGGESWGLRFMVRASAEPSHATPLGRDASSQRHHTIHNGRTKPDVKIHGNSAEVIQEEETHITTHLEEK